MVQGITQTGSHQKRPLRILSLLGQRPGFTGSGVLIQELWKCGVEYGDDQRLLCAGYEGDSWESQFGAKYSLLTFSMPGKPGELPFRIPGMSDVMPYDTTRYRDLSGEQVEVMLAAYQRRIIDLIRDFQPDILHIHHLWVLLGLRRVVQQLPVVVTVHGTDLKLAKTASQHRRLVADHLNGVDHFFCVSRDMLQDAMVEYGISRDRMSVLGNGYNPAIFALHGPSVEATSKIVLCVGKFVSWKGFRYAIRASALVPTNHQLVILGTGRDEEIDSLKVEAEACHANVLFPGHLSHEQVAAWMRRAEVFVLPSIHEPFGLVLLEAMACGCRVVASASGGPKDIIATELLSKGYASLISPLSEGDSEDEQRYVYDLAHAIQRQLQCDSNERVRSTIARSVAHMTWASVYNTMRAQYLATLTRKLAVDI